MRVDARTTAGIVCLASLSIVSCAAEEGAGSEEPQSASTTEQVGVRTRAAEFEQLELEAARQLASEIGWDDIEVREVYDTDPRPMPLDPDLLVLWIDDDKVVVEAWFGG